MSTRIDPIDHATSLIRGQLDAGMLVIVARETDPAAFPGYGETPTIDAICRRILGCLMNHGWEPPARKDHQ